MKLSTVTDTTWATRELRTAVRQRRDLPSSARLTFDALCDRLPNIFPSYRTLAADAGISRRGAIRAIRSLEAVGLIEIARGGGRRNNLYRLCVEQAPASDTHAESGDTGTITQPERGDTGVTPPEHSDPPPCHSRGDTDVTGGVTPESPEAINKAENQGPGPATRPAAAAHETEQSLAETLANAADYGAVYAEPMDTAGQHITALTRVSRQSGAGRVKAMMRRASGGDLRRWIAREIGETEPPASLAVSQRDSNTPEPDDEQDDNAATSDAPEDMAWRQVRRGLKTDLGRNVWRSYLKNLTFVSCNDGVVTLAARSRFLRDRIANEYGDRLRAFWHAHAPHVQSVEIVTGAG